MKCALCGFNYNEKENLACRGCPMSGKRCRLSKCPNCGYETPLEPKLVKLIGRWRKNEDQ